jgi:Skp family chaperone for outer membrane proteins
MNNFVKKIFILILLTFYNYNLNAEVPYFIDFKYVLNESNAGKKAQDELKKKLATGIKKIKEKEKTIQEEEKKVIQQKKIIKPEEYKNKVKELRTKVSNLQKERNKLLETVSKQRTDARNELLKNLNPIIEEYMKEKKIRMVIERKSLLLADQNLDITKDIMGILNKKLTTLKLN